MDTPGTNLPPGTPIAVQLFRGSIGYWIRGYEIFDPNKLVSTRSGLAPLEPKHVPRGAQCLVVRSGRSGRPILEERSKVRPITPDLETFDFFEIFRSVIPQEKKRKTGNGRKSKKRT